MFMKTRLLVFTSMEIKYLCWSTEKCNYIKYVSFHLHKRKKRVMAFRRWRIITMSQPSLFSRIAYIHGKRITLAYWVYVSHEDLVSTFKREKRVTLLSFNTHLPNDERPLPLLTYGIQIQGNESVCWPSEQCILQKYIRHFPVLAQENVLRHVE